MIKHPTKKPDAQPTNSHPSGPKTDNSAGAGYSLLHGRQKARRLSKRQKFLLNELLPKLQLDLSQAPDSQIKNVPAGGGVAAQSGVEPIAIEPIAAKPQAVNPQAVWLEIGFGGGEHLAWQAAHNRNIHFIGCEPFINGVGKALMLIDDEKLENIKLHANDARAVLDWLEPASIDRAFVLYPDPWPKKRHHKRRFLDVKNFNRLARVLKPGAELRIATDIGDYARHILVAYRACGQFTWTANSPDDWRVRPDDWPTTRYEQKAIREGRKGKYFIFQRN